MRRSRQHSRGVLPAAPLVPVVFVSIIFFLAGALVPGCKPKEPVTTTAAATPAGRLAKALPAEATVPYAQLMPPIDKPVSPPEARELSKRTKMIVQQAEELLGKGKYAQATAKLERAVGFAPNNARIRRDLGFAYRGMENYGKAQENLQKALAKAPDDLEAQLLFGRLAAGQKQYDRAIRAFRTALKCSGVKNDSAIAGELQFRLGRLLSRKGYYQAALECYTRLSVLVEKHGRDLADRAVLKPVVLAPARLLAERGRLLMELRRPDKAWKLLQRAYNRDRTDRRIARLLVEALTAAGRNRQAERTLIDLAAQPAQRPQLQALVGALMKKTKDKGLAYRFWRACRKKNKNAMTPSLAVGLASLAETAGALDGALDILKGVIAENPSNVAAARMIVRIYVRNGQAKKAMRVLAKIAMENPAATQAVRMGVDELASTGLGEDFERRFAESTDSEKLEAHYGLRYVTGLLAARRGKKLLAARQFQRSIDLRNDFLPSYDALLDLYLQQGRDDQVESLMRRIRKLDAKGYFYPYAQGKVAFHAGKLATAMELLKTAHDRNAHHLPTLLLLAETYRLSGQFRRATKILFQALQDHPDEVEIYRRLFDICLSGRNYRAAGAVANRLLQRQPGSVTARIMLAQLDIARKKRDTAKQILADLRRTAPKNAEVQLLSLRTNLDLSAGMLSRKDYESAVKTLDEMIRRDPRDNSARRLLVEIQLNVGLFDRAAVTLGQLYQATGRTAGAARAYVFALMRAGAYKSARQIVAAALRRHPDDTILQRSMVRVLARLGEYKSAVKQVDHWLKKAKNDTSKQFLRLVLKEVLARDKQYSLALKVLDGWRAVTAGKERKLAILLDKVRLLAEAKRYAEALKLLDGLIASSKGAGDSRTFRLRKIGILVKEKKFVRAQKIFDELIAKASGSDRDMLRSGKLATFGSAEDFAGARKYAAGWIKESPGALTPRQILVAVFVDAKKYAEALKLVEKWVSLGGATSRPAKSAEVRRWACETRVRLLAIMEKYKRALELAKKYEKLWPKNYNLFSLSASCLSQLGRDREALAEMEKALRLASSLKQTERDSLKRRELARDIASIQNNLGYMYAEGGIDLSRAEQLLRECLLVRPSVTAFQDSMAWIYYKQGRFREAGRRFRSIVGQGDGAETPSHPVIYDHAGDTFYRLGWSGKALKMWRRAVELAKKENKPSQEIRAVLTATTAKIRDIERKRRPKVAPTAGEMQVKKK